VSERIISIRDLKVYFPVQKSFSDNTLKAEKRFVHAIDGVSLDICRGETVALVGESGCGKSTIGRTIVGLNRKTSGEILIENCSSEKELRKKVQYVFQDPYSSLNPRMTVRTVLERPMSNFGMHKEDREERIAELMQKVGLSAEQMNRYPHEFSGGQRQRISIARSLAVEPEFIIADEPTAALDVSIQAQILNLLMELKADLGLTMLFITHDLSVVRQISDRVAVMYLGRLVEEGPTEEVFINPLHPYTKALLAAVPKGPNAGKSDGVRLRGSIPSPIDPPAGCRLHPRCPFATEACSCTEPELINVSDTRRVACLLCEKNKIQGGVE